jgi:hypothetical protein
MLDFFGRVPYNKKWVLRLEWYIFARHKYFTTHSRITQALFFCQYLKKILLTDTEPTPAISAQRRGERGAQERQLVYSCATKDTAQQWARRARRGERTNKDKAGGGSGSAGRGRKEAQTHRQERGRARKGGRGNGRPTDTPRVREDTPQRARGARKPPVPDEHPPRSQNLPISRARSDRGGRGAPGGARGGRQGEGGRSTRNYKRGKKVAPTARMP